MGTFHLGQRGGQSHRDGSVGKVNPLLQPPLLSPEFQLGGGNGRGEMFLLNFGINLGNICPTVKRRWQPHMTTSPSITTPILGLTKIQHRMDTAVSCSVYRLEDIYIIYIFVQWLLIVDI